jgi:ligand-binding SRPBCC domain-containing protein
MPAIYLETFINAPIEIVFDLARNIDLHKSSAAGTDENAISGKVTGLINLGERVTWRAKHFGLYQNLTVQITDFKKPYLFTDTMLKGAFSSMKHTHKFETIENGTRMTDIFVYKSPLLLLGRLADYLFLKNYMKKFLLERNKILKQVAEESPQNLI